MTDPRGGGRGRPAPSGAPAYRAPRTEDLIRQAVRLVEEARPMPLSTSSIINKEEVLAVLAEAVEALPEELRAARWLLKEREEHLARVAREADEIVEAARTRAEQMVQRTEVVKAAEQRARRVLQEADDAARRMRLETEDWCDQRLGAMEVVLEKTLRTVSSGRARLQGASNPPVEGGAAAGPAPAEGAAPTEPGTGPLFDQDASSDER